MSNKTDIAFANMLELEDEELEKEELEMMSGLCGFACLIPMQEMQLLEAYFFHRLKDSLVSSFLHPQNGKFVAKNKSQSSFNYSYYQTTKKKNFYPNNKEVKLAGSILHRKNYHMASALKMPSVIEKMTSELMNFFTFEDEKAYFGVGQPVQRRTLKASAF